MISLIERLVAGNDIDDDLSIMNAISEIANSNNICRHRVKYAIEIISEYLIRAKRPDLVILIQKFNTDMPNLEGLTISTRDEKRRKTVNSDR